MNNNKNKITKALIIISGFFIAIIAFAFLMACMFAGQYLVDRDYYSRAYLQCVIEAGEAEIMPSDFQKDESKPLSFTGGYDPSVINTKKPGKYPVLLTCGLYNYNAELIVEDTIAPKAEPADATIEYGETIKAEQLVKNICDETDTAVRYETEPDFTVGGKQTVNVIVEDAAGNTLKLNPVITIVEVRRVVNMEAGDELPEIDDFLLDIKHNDENNTSNIMTDLSKINPSKIGDYPIKIRYGKNIYESVLKIRDTVPPEITTRDYEGYTTSEIAPENFVLQYLDATDVVFDFEDVTDLTHAGEKDISIIATDAGGNKTRETAHLTLKLDTEPPVIKGAKDFTSLKNKAISYRKGVTVTDNCDKDVNLKIDSSAVNSKVTGSYPVIYTATDRAGNTAKQTINIAILDEGYSEASVYAMANQVLSRIITPGMSDYNKVCTIILWVKNNVSYTEVNIKNDWVRGAYYGLTKHKGDCYIHAMTAKALLDCAGIKNMIIDTLPLRYVHYWNLVDIGEGWKHCDSTPRRDKAVILYMNDASLTAFSVTHKNSHIYDRTRFPGIQ